ncbi:MAG: DUF1844 domain-containing protein [Candidatus Omnitrophica bacterium]|nr:DUF1844 domain-containing protein [Candidatus Omnitrophota bacterium]
MDREKFIDESWKEKADPEKGNSAESLNEGLGSNLNNEDAVGNFDLNFISYITSLGYQGMIFLGVLPNPITQESQKNLNQAKLIIDTLVMLRDKTRNNLTREEDDLLQSTIYELQVNFIEVSNNENKTAG